MNVFSNLEDHKQEKTIPFRWSARTDLPLVILLFIIIGLDLLLYITDSLPPIGLVILALAWLIYLALSQRTCVFTPMTMPALALLCLLPLSLNISVDTNQSLPKVYGLLLSVSIFFWLINAICCKERVILMIFGLVFMAGGVALVGLLATDWPGVKFGILAPVYNRLAAIIELLPGAVLRGRINANSLGGALAFFIPLLIALLWGRGIYGIMGRRRRSPPAIRISWKLLLFLILLLVGITLFQTQARGAFLGTAVGLLAVVAWKDRRFLWLIPILLAGLLLLIVATESGSLAGLIRFLDTSDNDTMPGRLEAWRNALYVIQDFPLTGIGIGTYNRIFKDIYLLNPLLQQGSSLFHAHNTFLSVTIDLGIPALVLYTALLGSFTVMVLRLLKSSNKATRMLALGLSSGMLAHQVFGIMDAYALGRNLGEILWIFYGCMTALYLNQHGYRAISISRQLIVITAGTGAWIMISLGAAGLVTNTPLLSVLVAVLGGFVLGAALVTKPDMPKPSYQQTTAVLDESGIS